MAFCSQFNPPLYNQLVKFRVPPDDGSKCSKQVADATKIQALGFIISPNPLSEKEAGFRSLHVFQQNPVAPYIAQTSNC